MMNKASTSFIPATGKQNIFCTFANNILFFIQYTLWWNYLTGELVNRLICQPRIILPTGSIYNSMDIIEHFICGKHTTADCEDGVVITPHFAAVIDGSTSKTAFQLHPDMKNGRFAMTLIAHYIQQMPANATIEHFCQGITQVIANVYKERNLSERMHEHPEERLTASAIIYSDTHHEVWMVGDCQAIIDGQHYDNSKPFEHTIALKRAQLITSGMSTANARHAIEPLLIKAMRQGQNLQYAVIDGTPIYMPGTRVVKATSSVIIASDGYPTLFPTLSDTEEALAQHLAIDPQNIHDFIATKGCVTGNVSFDDRAYIRLSVTNAH